MDGTSAGADRYRRPYCLGRRAAGLGERQVLYLEPANANTLERGGWTRKSPKAGDVVTVNRYLARTERI
jgi:hypothetical protein